jgi:hypothetical protein
VFEREPLGGRQRVAGRIAVNAIETKPRDALGGEGPQATVVFGPQRQMGQLREDACVD